MTGKALLLFFVILTSAKVSAQSSASNNDTIPDNILETECYGKVFTKVEKVASLKISLESFQDTLSTLTKAEKIVFASEKIIYRFFLTTKNKIFYFDKETGKVENEDKFKEIILSLANLWNPAVQNGLTVCAYTRLEITNKKGKLQLRIFQ